MYDISLYNIICLVYIFTPPACVTAVFALVLLAWIRTGPIKRMKLEDIHEAWGKHASDDKNGPPDHRIGGAATKTNNCILLPPFLRAFTALARIKYYGDDNSPQEESDHGSVNRLLLRDVFDNITNPTVSDIE